MLAERSWVWVALISFVATGAYGQTKSKPKTAKRGTAKQPATKPAEKQAEKGKVEERPAVPRPAEEAKRAAADKARVLPKDALPSDGRLGPPRTLRDPYHPWTPQSDLKRAEERAEKFRVQTLVSLGLWPMPPKTPLAPVLHGSIERVDYTIEKVYFESLPGHYVSGNLYRPKGREGKLPAVLSPHGHWANGRFYRATTRETNNQLGQKAEEFEPNARYPLQARMASLARMGCVVFHYDMVGNADSRAIGHTEGFTDVEAILRLQSFMGLQTWNSIRALDFLCSLPEVDISRVAVTGASGGGTQTFLLCALDPRPAVAFPAVMVSTNMQGGCICENAPLLRIGSSNIEFAALFAPKPYGMVGADDWTKEIETKGLPELKRHFALFGVPDNVMAKAYLQFKHNYNQVSRELMYDWLNRHLKLGLAAVKERAIDPVPLAELSVFDEKHPRPKGETDATGVRRYLTATSEKQLAELRVSDRRSFLEYHKFVGAALQAMVVDEPPAAGDLRIRDMGPVRGKGYTVDRLVLSRRQAPGLFPEEAIPTAVYLPAKWNGAHMIVWVHAEGHAGLVDADGLPNRRLAALLEKNIAVLSPDVLLTGEFHAITTLTPAPAVDAKYAGYTFCYNRTVLANRVHDLLTALGCARHLYGAKRIDLVGLGSAGPWAVLAKALAGPAVCRTVADFDGFSFADVRSGDDPRLLPGGLKYGDLVGLAALAAPGGLFALGTAKYPAEHMQELARVYDHAGNRAGLIVDAANDAQQRAWDWLLR